jgi:quercetin 2,3-dioxygenase
MITTRRRTDRGQADYGWLQAQYSFSFANYYDPNHMGFRSLRVLNEDRIAGGTGFPLHPHRDMEILTYVIEGGLAHEDSMGNGAVIEAGEFQLMSAGSGLTHSEANASQTNEVHLLQIWLQPRESGVSPSYSQRRFDDRQNMLRKITSPTAGPDTFHIQQDVEIFTSLLDAGVELEHMLKPGRHAWVQLISGTLEVDGVRLEAGDSAAISEESKVCIRAIEDAEFLLFDLA